LFVALQNQVQSWISYKRHRNEEEYKESHRIAKLYPIVDNAVAYRSEKVLEHECEATQSSNDAGCDSEHSSIDSVPSSAPTSPVQAPEISSPDESALTVCALRHKGHCCDTTPAFSPMKDARTENIQFGKHLTFNSASSALLKSTQSIEDASCSQDMMPSLCL
jgi:hypothetical protein